MMKFKGLVMGMVLMVASTTFGATVQTQVPTTVTTVQTQAKEVAKEEKVCYVTNTGSKFHKVTCKTLLKSKIEIKLVDAMLKYEPCKNCHSDLEYNELMKQAKQLKEEQKVVNKVQPTQPTQPTEQERTLTIASKPR